MRPARRKFLHLAASAAVVPALPRIAAAFDPPAPAHPNAPPVAIVIGTGHSSDVNALAFSPNGRTIVSAGRDRTAKLWDVATGRELRTFAGHESIVTAAVVSPDGRMIVSCGLDGTVRAWDAETGRPLHTLKAPNDFVTALAFSPDGRTIAAASGGGQYTDQAEFAVTLWEAGGDRQLRVLKGRAEAVGALAFAPDGRSIVCAHTDGSVRIWQVASGRLLRSIPAEPAASSLVVALSHDGRVVVFGGQYDKPKAWDTSSRRALRTFPIDGVRALAFSPDGRTLAVADLNKAVRLLDFASGRELRSYGGHDGVVSAIAFAPDGRTVVSANFSAMRIWEAASGNERTVMKAYDGTANSVAFSPDGRIIALAGSVHKDTLMLWDADTGALKLSFAGHGEWEVKAVAFAPDGRTFVSASQDHSLKLWDAKTGTSLLTFGGASESDAHAGAVNAVAFAPDGRTIVSGGGTLFLNGDTRLRLWDVATGRVLRLFAGHPDKDVTQWALECTLRRQYNKDAYCDPPRVTPGSGQVNAVAFSPDGRTIVSASWDKTLKLWDVATTQELRTLEGRGSTVTAAAFSPDGRIIAAGEPNTLRFWDPAAGRQLRALEPHHGGVYSLAFSPDGRTLVVGYSGYLSGGGLGFWDVEGGRELRTVSIPYPGVNAVAFAPDGRTLVSAGRVLQRWSVAGELLATSVALGQGQWLTITPEGFFDASQTGADILTVVRGFDVWPIEALRRTLQRPDLVREKLSGDPHGRVQEAAASLDLASLLPKP